MSTQTLKATRTNQSKHIAHSFIKPHLLNLSSSGLHLNGVIAERDVECPNFEYDTRSLGHPTGHVIVVYADNPAKLAWKIDGRPKETVFAKGDLIVNPAGLFTAPRWNAEVEFLLLAITPAFLSNAREISGSNTIELIPHYQFRDALLQHLAHNLIKEFEQDIPPDVVYAESLAHAFVSHLIKHYSVEGKKEPRRQKGLPSSKLQLVQDFVNDNLQEPVSLEAMAKLVAISPSYFVALFRQSTGITPHQYVMRQRINKAQALLTHTEIPIADIATQTGFADQSHLTRLLRRETGLTPGIYRSK